MIPHLRGQIVQASDLNYTIKLSKRTTNYYIRDRRLAGYFTARDGSQSPWTPRYGFNGYLLYDVFTNAIRALVRSDAPPHGSHQKFHGPDKPWTTYRNANTTPADNHDPLNYPVCAQRVFDPLTQ